MQFYESGSGIRHRRDELTGLYDIATLTMSNAINLKSYGLRSLADHETVKAGDMIKDSCTGQLNVVTDDTYHGLAIGVMAVDVREWNDVIDVLRVIEAHPGQ